MAALDDDDLGPCVKCDHGWVTVGSGYVEDHARLPDHVLVSGEDRDRILRARRAALAESVYPCRRCRPTQFFRWANGCGTPGHDVEGCKQCAFEAERMTKRSRR